MRISKTAKTYRVLKELVNKNYPFEFETTHPKVAYDSLTEQFYIELPKDAFLTVSGKDRESWAFTIAEKLYD